MTKLELYHLTEALESAKSELAELQRNEEWFYSDSLDQIEIALEILSKITVERT